VKRAATAPAKKVTALKGAVLAVKQAKVPKTAQVAKTAVRSATPRAAPPRLTAPTIAFPAFWDDAKRELMKSDRVLRRLIPQFEGVSLTSRGDPFSTLARSIVGQQISVAAAQAVWNRLSAAYPAFTPVTLACAKVDKLRTCGLSQRKAEYILDLAAHFKQGGDRTADWLKLEDEAVIKALTGIRGIGRWTAEMFLMFNLMRPDIFPVDDLGLRNASCVKSVTTGRPGALSAPGICGEVWTLCLWSIDGQNNFSRI
jgi:DNA-3-methyladenine glycosylase II